MGKIWPLAPEIKLVRICIACFSFLSGYRGNPGVGLHDPSNVNPLLPFLEFLSKMRNFSDRLVGKKGEALSGPSGHISLPT